MTLRLAIVGAGAIARELHLPAAAECPAVTIVAVVDSDEGRASELASQFNIPQAVTKISDGRDVDAIILATPPHVRVPLVREAADLGLSILAEKPLANTVAECRTQIDLAASAGIVLAVGHQYRFWPTRVRLAEVIADQSYGTVRHIEMSQGKPYSWKTETGYTVRKEMVPGGVLLNAGIHPLDTLLWWLGDPIDFDYQDDSIGGLESNFELDLEFSGSVTARLRQSRTSVLKSEIRIETDRAILHLGTYDRDRFAVDDGRRTEQIFCEGSDNPLQPAIDQLEDLAQAVSQGSSPRVTGEEGLRVISLIERCYSSKKQKPRPAQIPLPGMVW